MAGQEPHDYRARLDERKDLVDRLADGDIHALDSLFEQVLGARVRETRTIEPA